MLVVGLSPETGLSPEILCFGTFPVSNDETECSYVIRMEDIALESAFRFFVGLELTKIWPVKVVKKKTAKNGISNISQHLRVAHYRKLHPRNRLGSYNGRHVFVAHSLHL